MILIRSLQSLFSLGKVEINNLILLSALFICSIAGADYQTGLNAYNAARYTTALENWKAVAAQPATEVNPAIYAETHYAIGMLYWLGQGVEVDYAEASQWIRKAAELGNAGAQGKMGYLYTEGITVQKDYKQAFTWFSQAAKQGDVDGQYNLGVFYLNGWGTEQDDTLAAQYLAAAAAQGDESAEAALQGLLPVIAAGGKSKVDPGSSPGRRGDSHSRPDPEPIPRHSGLDPEPIPRHSGLDPEPIFLSKTWILAQNPNHYTIQVIGLSNQSRLEELVANYDHLAPFATYTLQRNNKALYLLIQGVYPSVEEARKAKANFPKAIQNPKELWIRQFGKIQALIEP